MICFELPYLLPSASNLREHWAAKHRRVASERLAASIAARAHDAHLAGFPLVVTITRVAKRPLDSDNCVAAAKAVRDGIADALGVDDGDARITWCYSQERGPAAVRVEVAEVRE